MYISKITVKNFRLLKDFSINLEKGLSLVIGKNNVGKTSLLKVLNRFLGNGGDGAKFQFNDFSISFRQEISNLIEGDVISEEDFEPLGISLRIVIHYEKDDDIEFVSRILLGLEPDNYYAAIGFDYNIGYTEYLKCQSDYKAFQTNEATKNAKKEKYSKKDVQDFIESTYESYFKIRKKAIFVDKDGNLDETNFTNLKDIPDFKIDDLISFKYIEAKRSVDNVDTDKTLSRQTSKLYELIEGEGQKQTIIDDLIDNLKEMDNRLNGLYADIFKEIREKIKMFGGLYPSDTTISVLSALSHKNLLDGNTIIKYSQDGKELPESYNGLGYMNLLSMIFTIEHIRQQFSRIGQRKPADLNLLFIEEPEAHTHPQLQYIFIQNIKKLLDEGVSNNGIKRPLQYIITSHSSHIVANCDFDDIKYMLLKDGHSEVKNISVLKDSFKEDKQSFAFLKQYLTLNRSELFFADKAIFIEGDTERMLLPSMMLKVDNEIPISDGETPLLSQNISIIEAGAYSQVFIPLINFLSLKKLCIITDIDCCKKIKKPDKNGVERVNARACRWSNDPSLVTSNSSLKEYFGKDLIIELDSIPQESKILKWNTESHKMEVCDNGNIRICFQIAEDGYHARSFEDGFFTINQSLMKDPKVDFKGLKPSNLDDYRDEDEVYDEFDLADDGIKSKATLAADILYAISGKDGHPRDWRIPLYIKEGLLWLRKD